MNINGYEIGAFADLSNANLRDANLRDANLRGANLRGAYLRGANLRNANLRDANLRDANLFGANLRDANLFGANLRGANLRGAYLRGADLRDANLFGADLRDANLRGADLRDANLFGAYLRGADLSDAENIPLLPWTIIVPEGDLIVYKKVLSSLTQKSTIIKLLIPKEAKRSNATTRKCRAEYAKVLECSELCRSKHDPWFKYEQGKIVRPLEPFDENRWNECAPGIHFFLTREEAEEY